MAVEIPVVVDIEGAFKDAAGKVASAMKPLKQAVTDKGVLELKFKTTIPEDQLKNFSKEIQATAKDAEDGFKIIERSFEQLWENGKPKLDDIRSALASFKQQLNAKWNNGKMDDIEVPNLQKAIILMEDYLNNRNRAVSLTEQQYLASLRAARAEEERNFILQREVKSISDINERISALRSKLDSLPKTGKGMAAEWTATGREIQKATAKLAEFEAKYNKVTTKPGSINRISAEMQALTDKWNAMSKAQKFDKDGNLKASAQKVIDKYKQLTDESVRFGKSLEEYANRGTRASNKLFGALSRVGAAFGVYASVQGLVRFVKQIRDVTGELEYQRVALGHLLQDVDFGNRLFERTVEAAKESPFRIKDLVTYTKQLAAYRIEQENLFDTTKRLADISAGLGVDMNRLILAYGQVRAASVLRGQELRQFTEAGIPLVELLAEKFSELNGRAYKTAEVFELISQRAVPFSMISEIFEDLTDKGGMFYKMQEEQAKTLKGRWEKLKDAYDQALMSIGDNKTFQTWNDIILKILNAGAKNLRTIVRALNAASIAWVTYKLATAAASNTTLRAAKSVMKTSGPIAYLTAGVKGLTRSWKALTTAFKTNWFGIILSAAAGIYTWFRTFKKETDSVTDSVRSLQKATEDMQAATKKAERLDTLIDRYERLSLKTERTVKENENLSNVLSRLKEEFPDVAKAIDAENLSLEEQIKRLKEANAEALAEERKKKERTLGTYERELADKQAEQARLEKDIEKAESDYNRAIDRRDAAKRHAESAGWLIKYLSNEKGIIKQLESAANGANNELNNMRAESGKLSERIQELTKHIKELRTAVYGDDAEGSLTHWQDTITKIQNQLLKGTTLTLFTPKEIEELTSAAKAEDALNAKLEEQNKIIEKNERIARTAKGATLLNAKQAAQDAKTLRDIILAIGTALGFVLGKTTPPRDTRLSQLKSEISELANAYKKFEELKKYKSEDQALIDVKKLFPQLGDLTPTLDNIVKELENKLAKVKADLAKSPKSKTLLDMQRALETEISNLRFDELKRSLEDKLKKLSDEIKRSEEARNFYRDVFNLTGDEDLATSLSVSVYGDVGSDFKERLQRQLEETLSGITIDADMRKAIDLQDFETILKKLPEGTEKVREEIIKLRDAQQKFSADQIKTWLNDLKKEKTYAEQRIALARKTQEEIAKINETVSDPQVRHELTMKYLKREQEEAAKLRYEAFKGSPLYVEMFGDLENATEGTLRTMRESVSEFMEQWKELKPTELKEMQSRLQEIDAQLAKKNPFKTLSDAIEEYNSLLDSGRTRNMDTQILVGRNIALGQAQDRLDKLVEQQKKAEDDYELAKKSNALDSEAVKNAKDKVNELKAQVAEQQAIVDQTQEMADEAARNAAQWKLIDRRVALARAEIEEHASVIKQLGSVVKDAFSLFVGDDAASTVDQIAGMFDTLTSSLKSIASAAARAELGDVAGAIKDGAQVVVGIATLGIQFAKFIESLRMKEFNDALEYQDEIIKRLERSYGRLEKKMAKAFGNEYAYYYTAAIEELQAKYEAYLAQMATKNEEAQKASGEENKEAARKEADELKHTAEEVLDEMDAMKEKLANFYAGTDLTSAAQEFAEAWLDAYQQFGSTTQAIKEKMQDMINSLIVKTALAGAAQAVLGPFFEKLEEMAGKKGGMTYKDIAEVVGTLQGSVGDMNAVLSSVMQVLRANGIDVRNTVGSFKGVAHEVATASEESILALAAGINTQNFYMASINANVQQIVTMLSGGAARDVAPQSAPAAAGALSVQELMNTHLPSIRYDIAEIRSMLSDVIKSAGAPATKYVATKM